MEQIGKILIILFAFVGFLIASYIRSKKHAEKPLVCPLEGSCENVVHSSYSTLFGIPLEIWGMFYYGITLVSYTVFFLFPEVMPLWASYILLGLSLIAFTFSIYLTAIQAFLIHHWCTWCLFSAGISTLIFLICMSLINENILLVFMK